MKSDSTAYHLAELRIASDPTSEGHLLPTLPDGCVAVLDVGCGAGQTLINLKRERGITTYGVDPDADACRLGRSLTKSVRFVCAQAEDLPFRGNSFDFVISRVALPYTNIPRALAEIAAVTRSGGYLWLSLHPTHSALHTLRRAFRDRRPRSIAYSLYTLLNAVALQTTGRLLAWPFGTRRYESVQTVYGMRSALKRAGFCQISVSRNQHFVIQARRS